MKMTMTDFLVAQLNREVERSHRALEQVPAGHFEFKPHDRSMILGYLTGMVATIPSWIALQVTKNELDVAPEHGSAMPHTPSTTAAELLAALDASATTALKALQGTTDDHLETLWQLKSAGQVVMEAPRYIMIEDTFSHWSHHRGQLTVYLRMIGAKVPALFGPSADEKSFR